MKIQSKQDASARILSRALQSAFGSALPQKDPIKESRKVTMSEPAPHWSNTDSPLLPEAMVTTSNFQPIPSRMSSWVESSLLAAIDETLQKVPENETDEWAKKNRLQALKQLVPFTIDSKENMSPVASSGRVSSESSKNLHSSKRDYLKDIPVSKYESRNHERHFIQQQGKIKPEFSQKQDFLENQNCSQATKSRNCCEPTTTNRNNLARLPSYNVSSMMALKSFTGFFDSHCHIDLLLNDEGFNGTYADYMAQHQDSYPESYNGCIAIFCKPWTFAKVHEWQKHLQQANVWAAFGCHPKQAKYYNQNIERHLEYALNHPKVRALGEIGLDYSKKNERSRKEQHFVFRRQLEIAQKRNLRVVIHCRDADDDAIKIMHEILPKDAVFHLHCFTGSWVKAQMWIREFPNVYIGITNLVTFPDADKTHEVARQLPLNRLLLETDAPFFVPKKAPRGTKYSHPGMAIHVAAQVAALKDVPLEEVLQATCANTKFVYNIS